MSEAYRPKRRKKKKWSAKRWRFELTRVGVLLVLLLLLAGLFQGCRAVVKAVSGDDGFPEDSAFAQTVPTERASTPLVTKPVQRSDLDLIMVGDVLLHTPLQESGEMADGTLDYSHFFTYTADRIAAADLALVNQEVILGGSDLGLSGYPAFNGAFEVGDALAEAGFDVVLHATNHALDKGSKGLLNCLNFWETNYPEIAVLGIHDSAEDQDALYFYDWNGYTIAILNYTYSTNGVPLPESYMVDMLTEQAVIADLERANAEADFVIVCPHWGTEYTHTPSSSQKKWAQLFLDYGVDLVLGTHPHVIQPVEWMQDDSGNEMLVYWSLGNYINFTSDSGDGVRQRAVGAMAEVTLSVESGQVVIADYGVTPLIAHMVQGSGNPTVYALEDYTQALAEENAMSRKDPKFSLDYCREICREVFGDLMD